LTRSLKEKDNEINSLRSTNRILDERASIIRNQLQELQRQLLSKQQELEEIKRNTQPSR